MCCGRSWLDGVMTGIAPQEASGIGGGRVLLWLLSSVGAFRVDQPFPYPGGDGHPFTWFQTMPAR